VKAIIVGLFLAVLYVARRWFTAGRGYSHIPGHGEGSPDADQWPLMSPSPGLARAHLQPSWKSRRSPWAAREPADAPLELQTRAAAAAAGDQGQSGQRELRRVPL
jgi:hypothetical protein